MDGQKLQEPRPRTGFVSPQEFGRQMRERTSRMLERVMEAVNQAPDGAWINGSEMQVRDLLEEYRREVFEAALQQRTDAAEGAFSPGGPVERPTPQEQGH